MELYRSSSLSHHDQMEMVLSSCQQIHKADFLGSVLHSQVFTQAPLQTLTCFSFFKYVTLRPILCFFPADLKDAAYARSLGSRLLNTVYKGIAPGEDRKALPSLDINTKRLADGLLQLAFALSQQVGGTSLLFILLE